MKAAIALYVDVLRERGGEVPQPRAIQAVTLPAAWATGGADPERTHRERPTYAETWRQEHAGQTA